jgi:hypothetical protein
MKQAGRRSAADLAVVTAMPLRLLQAPADLTTDQAAIWSEIVASKPHDWWDAASVPLLSAYCRAAVESRRVGHMVESVSAQLLTADGDLKQYETLRKLQAQLSAEMTSLATKMRLSQQSRYRADAAAVKNDRGGGKKPWLQGS